MQVRVSVAVSIDGYLDDTSSDRLILSSAEDWREVRQLRSRCDAILVGAETIRRDNPALVIRDKNIRTLRESQGMPADLIKVTLTNSGEIDSKSRFFTEGEGEKIVFVGPHASPDAVDRLRQVATVIREDHISASLITKVLESRGIRSLLVEGGSKILTLFFQEGVVDYLRLAVAPFFVGETNAPRVVDDGLFPFRKNQRMYLIRAGRAGDMAIMDYALRYDMDDYETIRQTIALAEESPKSDSAYSVGAAIVTARGTMYTGFSRETAPDNHAEEEAVKKALTAGESLNGAVIYSSMEPCSTRKSKSKSCSELIINYKMKRVVFAAYEPDSFVNCCGAQRLVDAGIEVSVIDELSDAALAVNHHILKH